MRVKHFMSANPICCPPHTTIEQAVTIMVNHDIGAILVTIEKHLLGIFTERDLMNRIIFRHLDPKRILVEDAMTKRPHTVHEMEELIGALRKLIRMQFRHFPVIRNNQLAGLLSLPSQHLSELLVAAEHCLGYDSYPEQIKSLIQEDFELELNRYTKEYFGTKEFKAYQISHKLEVLKSTIRKQFHAMYYGTMP